MPSPCEQRCNFVLCSISRSQTYTWHIAYAYRSFLGWMNEFINIHCPPSSLWLGCSLSSSFTQLTTGSLRLFPSSKKSHDEPPRQQHVFFLYLLVTHYEYPCLHQWWHNDMSLCGFSISRFLESLFMSLCLPLSSVLAQHRYSVPTVGMNGGVKWINLGIICRQHLPTSFVCVFICGLLGRWLRKRSKVWVLEAKTLDANFSFAT